MKPLLDNVIGECHLTTDADDEAESSKRILEFPRYTKELGNISSIMLHAVLTVRKLKFFQLRLNCPDCFACRMSETYFCNDKVIRPTAA